MSVALTNPVGLNSSIRQEPLRVMIVDDAVVVRGMISRWVDAEPDIVVAASLRTGLEAVNQVERIDPDVVVLDIEMPELDGISALPQLLAKKRDLIVIMASTLTRRNAEISFKALSLGASDYIPKPESTREPSAAEIFRHDLIQKIRQLGAKVAARLPLPHASPRCRRARRLAQPAMRRRAARTASLRRDFSDAPRVLRDRLVDRRPAGAESARRRNRPRDRPLPRADHPAHAADLHDNSGRASGARQPRPVREAVDGEASRPARSISRRAAAICAWCATAPRR